MKPRTNAMLQPLLAMLILGGCRSEDKVSDTAQIDDTVCSEMPEGRVSLPADDAPHEESIEWWYWTGHLQDDAGRWYGFEHTVFRFALGVFDGTVANTAVTDIDAGEFHHDEPFFDGWPEATTDSFDLPISPSSATGGDGHDILHGEVGPIVYDLELDARKAPVFQHGDGYHDYSAGGYTYYYSRQRMTATGTLNVDGEDREVTGEAWFDHQWGQLFTTSNAGWDWFALQLEDDREVMLFMVRGESDVIGGTLTEADCTTRELESDEVTVTATGTWTSPHSGCEYPQGWEIDVAGEHYVVTPYLADQEVYNDNNTYWEGASAVSGDSAGRAYVELAGYCPQR